MLAGRSRRLAESHGRLISHFLRAVVQRGQQRLAHARIAAAADRGQILDGLDLLGSQILFGLDFGGRFDGRVLGLQVRGIGDSLQRRLPFLLWIISAFVAGRIADLVDSLGNPKELPQSVRRWRRWIRGPSVQTCCKQDNDAELQPEVSSPHDTPPMDYAVGRVIHYACRTHTTFALSSFSVPFSAAFNR